MQSKNSLLRRGASQVVTAFLVLTIVALLGVIVMLLIGRESPQTADNRAAAKSEQVSPKSGESAAAPQEPNVSPPTKSSTPPSPPKPAPPPPPKPVGDPERIRDVLQQGKTYESTLKVGFQAAVIDADWGVRQTISLVYEAENRMRRTVERNDGQTVVLLCHVVESRAVKLLTDVEVTFDLGQPGTLLLGALDYWLTGGQLTAPAVVAAPVAEAILTEASRAALKGHTAKAKAMLDSLAGKRFRVTYIDGKGLVSLEPVGCTLTEEERDYLEGMSVLGDCYLLPDVNSRPGQYWDVEARELVEFLPPTWRGRPSGVVTIERGQDFKKGDKDYATLKIRTGTFQVNASDRSRRRLADVTPRGELYYNITDGYIDRAELRARASVEDVSTDHLLFESRFQTAPELEIQYTCQRLEGPMGSGE
ncbi:MAG TPA: hypothetical protein PLD05_13420 [Thermogutta sp.]|nr:hypothetical protein [Thermogutta sp.]